MLAGRLILVVEDEYLIAADLAAWLEGEGAEVLGPAASVEDALDLVKFVGPPDASVLDINLGDEKVFPVADALRDAGVPFLFLSGYDARVVPEPYQGVPCCPKPLDHPRLLRSLSKLIEV